MSNSERMSIIAATTGAVVVTGTVGYLYFRYHESYGQFNACKMGITGNIPERDSTYKTGEIVAGCFLAIYKVSSDLMTYIETLLHSVFIKLHLNKYDGGNEFYDLAILEGVENALLKHRIEFEKMTEDEIQDLNRKHREKFERERDKAARSKLAIRDYQIVIIDKTAEYFLSNSKGILNLTCGVGKTLISLWVAQRMAIRTTVIGVPYKDLVEQWVKNVRHIFGPNSIHPVLCVVGQITEQQIQYFMRNNSIYTIITTYKSCYKVKNACLQMGATFGMKINDEVHHLASVRQVTDPEKYCTYSKMMDIPATYHLSLTATLKSIEDSENPDDTVVLSNSNIAQFGDVIDRKSMLWAIQNGIICDYVIQTIITDASKLEGFFSKFSITHEINKRLFLSAYCTLKSVRDGRAYHGLVYANNMENSKHVIRYIGLLLEHHHFEFPAGLSYGTYNSNMKNAERHQTEYDFYCKQIGILSCVYCLSEGKDMPPVNSIIFAENMQSSIRIVQTALRPCRKNPDEPDKVFAIILPILDFNNREGVNPDMKKVQDVIRQLGQEDHTIEHKIKAYRLEFKEPEDEEMVRRYRQRGGVADGEFVDDEELTRQVRLRTVPRAQYGINYDKARHIIQEHGGVTSHEEYKILCKRDCRLPTDPEEKFGPKFHGWIDYYGISRQYYNLDECRARVVAHLVAYPEDRTLNPSEICEKVCEVDVRTPPRDFWVEYYKEDGVKSLDDITKINNKTKVFKPIGG